MGAFPPDGSLAYCRMHAGFDLFKTQDGVTWLPVTIDGLGDAGNYGARTMQSVGDSLYLGTANPFEGLEVWCATTPTE